MMKALFSTLAAAATLIAVPAIAAERAGSAASVPAPTANQDAQQRPETRYCVMGTTTGTLLPSKTCRTRAEWLKYGFDPIAK